MLLTSTSLANYKYIVFFQFEVILVKILMDVCIFFYRLLILDEIDHLDSKNQEVLYTMFEWPALKKSRLVLIGKYI